MNNDKNCQTTQCVHMCTAMKSSNMWLPKPAVPYKYIRLCSDKNCQSTRCYRKKSPARPRCSNDKNCQSTMQPKKPISNIQPVKPTVCSDKH